MGHMRKGRLSQHK